MIKIFSYSAGFRRNYDSNSKFSEISKYKSDFDNDVFDKSDSKESSITNANYRKWSRKQKNKNQIGNLLIWFRNFFFFWF